ncbi:MAG TPA: hypothetical protein DD381_12235 [Lentisphaeria bacterium]|nr:MAG: hypothetical protein A2X47_09500 [Lentisphaerae bacterium GWF2_38_69]HBM17094.1 hypothetical protein [Lentisphaeria bacterium]
MSAKNWTQEQLGTEVGVEKASVNQWLLTNGKGTKSINEIIWDRLFPLIMEYLPKERIGGTLLTGYYYISDTDYDNKQTIPLPFNGNGAYEELKN